MSSPTSVDHELEVGEWPVERCGSRAVSYRTPHEDSKVWLLSLISSQSMIDRGD